MTLLIMNMIILTSLIFSMMTHPLSMGLTVLIQVILVAMLTGTMTNNFWFSYILFMVMVGGMLVLFIYMTSIASNEKFTLSMNFYIMSSMIMTSTLMSIMMDNLTKWLSSTNLDMTSMTNHTQFEMTLSKYFNSSSSMIMIMLIIYLLITLIAVVKITNIKYGPLRKMN
uniref:NADH-ubiquinone oxidoreductase chain 6 n=1 Tax=Elateroidea sp. 1 KM-2017 TaxID=2219423 RepID=A0A346RJW9_9COLE|nr:NADH dehydrogenase subunit 6 [Elateroidea sp. 1 KM-2017]